MSTKPKNPIALVYSRISDPDDTREASLDSQEDAAVALLEKEGYRVPTEYRFREQYTGMESIHDRPVLGHCRRLVAEGKVGAWGCYHTDRLCREPLGLITIVTDNSKHDVITRFVKLGGVFEGRFGEGMLYLAGMASAIEWDQIRDRTMRGRQDVLGAGKWLGGGPVRYGYRADPGRRARTACPDTAPIVRMIFRKTAEGMSTVELTRYLNDRQILSPAMRRGAKYKDGRPKVWVQSTVIAIIKDHTYIGEPTARKTRPTEARRPNGKKVMVRAPREEWVALADARTEALVGRELFEAANAALIGRKPKPVSTRRVVRESLLRGMIWCAHCGSRMTPVFRVGADRGATYRCTGDDHARGVNRTGCASHVGARWVEVMTIEAIEHQLFRPGFLRDEVDRLSAPEGNAAVERDLKAWQKRRKAAERRLAVLLDQDVSEATKIVREMVRGKINELDREIREADAQVADLSRRLVPVRGRERILAAMEGRIAAFCGRWTSGRLAISERREILIALGCRVEAYKGKRLKVEVNIESLMAAACAEDEHSSSGTFDFCARITLPISA